MANSLIASPGRGGSPRTVARSRTGVWFGARSRIQTGAITTRAPRWPGLSTSTTQASTTVGVDRAGAMGAATKAVRAFAAAKPAAIQAIISNGHVIRRDAPRALARPQADAAAATARASGQNAGSTLRAK